MKIKVKIPTTIEDITLDQYQRYYSLIQNTDIDDYTRNNKIIQIFTGIKYQDVKNINQVDYEYLLHAINLALEQPAEFKPIFEIKGMEFGFITNFDKITTAEFFNIEAYPPDQIENLHKLMAVLFRPIKTKDPLGNYKIHSYEGVEVYSDAMKYMPLSVVNGALVFFWNLSNELLIHIQKYTKVEQEKALKRATISRSGVGILLSKLLPKVRYGKLKPY